MNNYDCYYLMQGDEPGPLATVIRIEADDAICAAYEAMAQTGCANVTDVVRVRTDAGTPKAFYTDGNPLSATARGASVAQSDFEKSLAFRLTLLVAFLVVGINVFSPDPAPVASRAAVRASV